MDRGTPSEPDVHLIEAQGGDLTVRRSYGVMIGNIA
jgi:hypothetical protein